MSKDPEIPVLLHGEKGWFEPKMNPPMGVDLTPEGAENLTVEEIKALDLSPRTADQMLRLEKAENGGKNRKTVLAHLQKIINAK